MGIEGWSLSAVETLDKGSRLGESQTQCGARLAGCDFASMEAEGKLSSLLALPQSDLGGGLPEGMDDPGHAVETRTDEESRADAQDA
jgi:hypothetical protein